MKFCMPRTLAHCAEAQITRGRMAAVVLRHRQTLELWMNRLVMEGGN